MNSVCIKSGTTAILATLAITAGLYSSLAHAKSAGVGDNTDIEPDGYNSITCTEADCHSGGSYNSGTPTFTGSTSVAIGSSTAYSVRSTNTTEAQRKPFYC